MTKLYIIAAIVWMFIAGALAGTVAPTMDAGGLDTTEAVMLLALLFGPWTALYVHHGKAMARREAAEAQRVSDQEWEAAEDITYDRLR